ncbi:sulfatase-like protein [Achlya hypogyna]|uniref:Sulfatase-like protein n=1 Tax=Achlya hypogyna TaxID=1202772 RepID=A0A1V9YGV4_ACHHY|nr:sulfatase-like protein [Achlya hypogyna]
MVTVGQVVLTLVAGSYLIGRKELPVMAKAGGRYVGRTVGAVLRAKNEYFEATKDSEIVKMQTELQKGLDELNQIRSELTTISSMKRPMRPVSAPGTRLPNVREPMASAADMQTHGSYAPPITVAPQRMPATNASLAPSVDHTDRAYEDVLEHADDQDQARLALAELNMAKQKHFTAHIESIEGGADYVSASLMDSFLLKRVNDTPNPQQPQRAAPPQ